MSVIEKILDGMSFSDGKGNVVKARLTSSAVVMPDGVTSLPDKLTADAAQQTAALDTAIAALKSGDIKSLSDSLASTHKLVDDFLNGTPTDDGVMNRMVELVTQIEANKGTIDDLLTDKISTSAIINDLTTGGTDKVLSAEQGKALKTLLDALDSRLSGQIAGIHSHGNKDVLDGVTSNHLLLSSKMVSTVPAEWPADVRSDGVLWLVATA